LLIGFANGFLVTFSNVYTAEAAPAHLRGVMVALFAYWVNIGAIIGNIVDNYMKTDMGKASFRVPIACLYIVPTFLSIALLFCPESPRWLLHKGRDAEAERALRRLRGNGIPEEHIEFEWAEMIRGVEEEKMNAKSVAWLDMFRGVLNPFACSGVTEKYLRILGSDLRRTLLCYATIASQAGSGFWWLINYSVYFYAISGITKAFQYSIMNACIGFFAVNLGMLAMQHLCGRRTIMMFGAAACGFCHLGMAIAQSVKDNGSMSETRYQNCVVAFFALSYFFYNGTIGSASYPVATELVSSRLRAWTVGSATSLGYVLAWLVAFCTPYFINPTKMNWASLRAYRFLQSRLANIRPGHEVWIHLDGI
jgi:Sugar (and other) transporter